MAVREPLASDTASGPRAAGLLRALLVAHAQMMVNRTRRGLGRRGLVGFVLVLLILFCSALPLFGAFGVLGFLFGRGIERPVAAPLMGVVLTGTALGFGVVGGLLGGARQLTWDAYRSFPVPFRTLFFAETLASLGDLVVLGFLGMTAMMGGAFAWMAPALTPFVLLLLGQMVLWVLFVQQLVGSLAVSAVRRLRRAMGVLFLATWAGVSVVASAARELQNDLQGPDLLRLRALWHDARPLIDRLPPVLSVRAMVLARQGSFGRALLLELPLLAGTMLLGVLSYAVLRREERPQGARDREAPGADRRFRARVPPAWTLARLHFHHIARSLQGRFGLVVPLITVVMVRGPLLSAGVGAEYTLPGSVLYVALAATQFHFNQFGLDGQGVKTLFLLPVSMRDVLLGKTLALLAYAAVQNFLLLVLLALVLRPTPADLLAAALLAACLAIAHALEGHWISVVLPRPLAMHRMNATGLSGAQLLPLAVGMLNGAAFGSLYALAWRASPGARVPVLAVFLVAMVALYRTLLPHATKFATARRETVVEILG